MKTRKATTIEREPALEGRRNAMDLMQSLREQIESGGLPRGTYMPPVRRLSRTHGVAANTAVRALRMLIDQGLLEARPRKGFWIREERARDVSFVYLMSPLNLYAGFDALYKALMDAFRACTEARGEHLATIVLNPGDELHALRRHGLDKVNGLVLDQPNPVIEDAARRNGIPVVLIDDEDPRGLTNAVIQANAQGGDLAARHLLAQGCTRVAWFGKKLDHHHARARYGAAVAALAEAGQTLAAQALLAMDANQNALRLEDEARAMLEQRPDGVLALWRPMAQAVAAAARRMNLRIGRDFQMAGWTCEELYGETYTPLFDGPPPAAVVWSARDMAALALQNLRARPEAPSGAAVNTLVPVTLRTEPSPA
ncbi:MAG: substrate-binding domain-containing protein [Planctomycetota bacterium]|nr:substrate-binding domain-containing protein [Planctomycetota bacterium]